MTIAPDQATGQATNQTTAGAPDLPVATRPTLLRRGVDLLAPDRPAQQPPLPRVRRSPREVRLLALAALLLYLLAGWYLRHVLHFGIGDALARTANAKYMLFARDAHLAALGFVWMPIPTVSQLPAVLLLEPLGLAADAGWVTTALWGAATVLVLGRMTQDLGVRRPLGLLLVAAYAFNPVIVYYAANGMSEGPLFFFLALTFLGVFRYLRDDDSAALVSVGIGLAGAALDRYEAIPLIVFVGGLLLVVNLRRRGRHEAMVATALATLPAVGSVLGWFVYMKVIKGSFRAFITDAAGTTAPGTGTASSPASAADYYANVTDGMAPLAYSLHWVLAFAPALVLLPLVLVPPLRRSAGGLALLLVGLWLPAVTFQLLRVGGTAGDPRYFTSVIVVTAVGAIYLAGRVPRTGGQLLVVPLLVAALGVGWVTGPLAQVDRSLTKQEGEWRAFEVLRGNVDTRDTRGIVASEVFAADLDRLLGPDDRVLLDVRFTFEVELYSRKPDRFIINNDRDYEQIRADPYLPGRRIDYLVFPEGASRGAGNDYAQAAYNLQPSAWERVTLPRSQLLAVYHRR